MLEYGFSLTRICPYKDRIYDPEKTRILAYLIGEKTELILVG